MCGAEVRFALETGDMIVGSTIDWTDDPKTNAYIERQIQQKLNKQHGNFEHRIQHEINQLRVCVSNMSGLENWTPSLESANILLDRLEDDLKKGVFR